MDATDDQITAWSIPENGEVGVCDDTYIANHSQIRTAFRYVRRMSTYWTDQVVSRDVAGLCLVTR